MDVRVKLNERRKSEELGELLRLKPVSLMIKKSRLRWFGHVERKDDTNWVKRCITWEVEGIRQRTPDKDLVGLCSHPKRMCSPGINGEGELRGQPANPGSPGKNGR